MLHRLQWHRWDGSGSDSAKITMCTLVWQRWQLTVLWQRCLLWLVTLLQWCAHRSDTNVNTAVTEVSVVTAITAQLSTPLSQYCHNHRCHTNGICHCFDIGVDSSVTVVCKPQPMCHRCEVTPTYNCLAPNLLTYPQNRNCVAYIKSATCLWLLRIRRTRKNCRDLNHVLKPYDNLGEIIPYLVFVSSLLFCLLLSAVSQIANREILRCRELKVSRV